MMPWIFQTTAGWILLLLGVTGGLFAFAVLVDWCLDWFSKSHGMPVKVAGLQPTQSVLDPVGRTAPLELHHLASVIPLRRRANR